MVRAVSARSMGVALAIVARQLPVEGLHQVSVGPSSELHDHDAGRGMWHEDVEQAVALAAHET